MFCKHDYQLIDKEVIKPPILDLKRVKMQNIDEDTLLSTTVIHFFKCSKCKKIKRVVTKS